jgi:DNA-binding MarR family transcriptional regulator
MIVTYHRIQERLKTILEPFDVTVPQYNVLRILQGAGGPLTTSTIRDRMMERKSDSSRLVDRMSKKGWVTRKTNVMDRRLVDVELSSTGKQILERIDVNVKQFDEITSGLNHEEAVQFNELLDKMRKAIPE